MTRRTLEQLLASLAGADERDTSPYLRFELGDDIPTWPDAARRRRVEQAVTRATTLFEAAVPEDHAGRLDVFSYFLPDHPRDESQLIATVLPANAVRRSLSGDPREIAPEIDAYLHGDEEFDEEWEWLCTFVSATLRLRELDYSTLFRLIANRDLGLEPSTGGRSFLTDETDPLVFHMYDDRGAMLVAPTAERLAPLHERWNEWLVDYDRAVMDSFFT